MEFRFSDHKLEDLYTQGKRRRDYPEAVVDAFLRRVRMIEAAKDERDLRTPASVHFERLKGRLKGRCSLRLHGGWRLILRLVKEHSGTVVAIEEISKHYGD